MTPRWRVEEPAYAIGSDEVSVAMGTASVAEFVGGHVAGRADVGVRMSDGHGVGALGSRIVVPVVRVNRDVGGVVGRRGEKQALGQGGVPWVDVGGAGTGYAMGLT